MTTKVDGRVKGDKARSPRRVTKRRREVKETEEEKRIRMKKRRKIKRIRKETRRNRLSIDRKSRKTAEIFCAFETIQKYLL